MDEQYDQTSYLSPSSIQNTVYKADTTQRRDARKHVFVLGQKRESAPMAVTKLKTHDKGIV